MAGSFKVIKWVFPVVLALALSVLVFPHSSSAPQGCLGCHQGIESPGPNHAFPCQRCHGGDPKGSTREKAHKELIANPSRLDQASRRCLPCHESHLFRVQRSLMATAAGEINQTRYLWGAQDDPKPGFLTRPLDQFPVLPPFSESGQLVDDLLRRRCLRCHLYSDGTGRFGEWRAQGCAACHMPYGPDGLSQSRDQALRPLMEQIRKNPGLQKRGYPLIHRFTKAVPTRQCLTCHNGHRVGMDYVGLAERDYHESYRFFSPDGEKTAMAYGFDPRMLKKDIHCAKGLHCLDCHGGREVMGDGRVLSHSMEQVNIRCADCHGTPQARPRTMVLKAPEEGSRPKGRLSRPLEVLLDSKGNPLLHVIREPKGIYLYSKIDGSRHRVPLLAENPAPVAHRIPEHIKQLECHSCHALWSYQDFGLHLIREDRADYQKWASLWLQNDPQVQGLLQSNLPLKREQQSAPVARDYLSGSLTPGIWYSGWSYRRLESPIFGINERGRTSVFRPLHQFVVSWVDDQGKTLWDSRILKTREGKMGLGFNPYAPHTIQKQTRPCEGCHLNPRALGLGNRLVQNKKGPLMLSAPLTSPSRDGLDLSFEWEALVNQKGSSLQTQTRPRARPYNRRELGRLMNLSQTYQGFITLDLKEKGKY
jgi:hypothetical protein